MLNNFFFRFWPSMFGRLQCIVHMVSGVVWCWPGGRFQRKPNVKSVRDDADLDRFIFFFSCLVKEWTTKRPIYHKVYCLIWKKNHLRFIGQAYQNSNFLILFFGEKNGRQRTELYSLIFYGIIFFSEQNPECF